MPMAALGSGLAGGRLSGRGATESDLDRPSKVKSRPAMALPGNSRERGVINCRQTLTKMNG